MCNGRKTIAVGAYDARITGAPMTRFSSSGPTRDGRAKPDIAAPGAGIRAARSRPRRQQSGPDRVVQKSGTSMAAPHVTGTVALMFEAALPWRLTIEQTRAALLHTARPVTPVHRLDGIRSGAGRVDGVAAVTAVRQLLSRSTSNPSIEDHFIMSRNSEPFISGYRSEAEWALSWLQECGSRSEDIPTHLHGAILAEVLTTRDSLPTWYEASIQQGRPCGKDIATPEIHFDAAHKSNFTVAQRTARDIDAIVIHTVEGSARSAISAFKNPSSKVSSHFVISQTGAITQMVAVKNVAWTQTYYNPRAIGIECEGRACDPNTWTTALMTSLVQLTAWLSRTYQIPLVHPCGRARVTDLSVKNGQITGRVDRLNVSGLIGHEQIQPWNKNDPGPFFDWKLFLAALGQICR
ncbi:MAG: N-acetylmuramoyl-L-alanine amidase [Myxococcota bacterium]